MSYCLTDMFNQPEILKTILFIETAIIKPLKLDLEQIGYRNVKVKRFKNEKSRTVLQKNRFEEKMQNTIFFSDECLKFRIKNS